MARKVEFYYDFVSPNAYFSAHQIGDIVKRCGAEIEKKPIFLGGVFKALGTSPPLDVPARATYLMAEVGRWGKKYGIPFRFPAKFPLNTVHALRGSFAMEEQGKLDDYIIKVFDAFWAEGKEIDDKKVLAEIVASIGGDVEKYLARIGDQEIKDKLRKITEDAIARGAFGAPTFFVGDEMLWGKDRLDFVEDALKQGKT